jgi:hypothetical protein
MVKQDANHVAAEQASEFDSGLARCPRLRDGIETLHRQACMWRSTEVL